ncbi:hypothetical protein LSTR_LSTR000397 [Laodelphax striatellus]|uniref:Uncharacterized protein n=1 Tax=Laodelphax striatellus TaxID=195883 RepID=A0A482X4S7_LAOST|nr:hypothetical protein LSTR_LSTR000397 [Laodelphax striatellus]
MDPPPLSPSTSRFQIACLIFLAVFSTVCLLPPTSAAPGASPSDSDFEDVFYDQRQNGSENFRIHLNDVMVVVAPAEALLSVAGSDLLGGAGGGGPGAADLPVEEAQPHKECKQGVKGGAKCSRPSSGQNSVNNKRSRLRLSNFLLPFINRAHH